MKGNDIKSLFLNLSAEKYKKYLFYTAVIGFALVFFSSVMSDSEKDKAADNGNYSASAAAYCSDQEKRLQNILSSIEGVGSVKVMLTLENGVEYRYAADEKQSGDSVLTYADGSGSPSKVQQSENSEQNYIMIGSSGNKKPLVLTELTPKVKGVVVVCGGGDDPVVIKRITDAVTTALGINSLQVCVAKASK